MPSRHRRSVRLPGYDYARPGAYFVTLCTHERACLFGDVVGDAVRLTWAGGVARRAWEALPTHAPHVAVDAFVVMPNHLHGVLLITAPSDEPARASGAAGTAPGSLGALVQSYKSVVTRRVNRRRETPGGRLWQRSYWDRVVRSERELDAVRRYIRENPARWHFDRLYPTPPG